ncbi:MAG: ECF transporter S component [Clostridium sp.]
MKLRRENKYGNFTETKLNENELKNKEEMSIKKSKLDERTVFASVLILIVIPITILFGVFVLKDRKYYFISLAIVMYTMIPFFMVFEKRKPQARELIIISVLSAIAVAGRAAFFMVPQFKPVVAIVIITGVCFGAEAGFLVGAITGFVSNFFFGQGPWTPWQMFGFGIIGFLAGILFKKGKLKKNRIALCIYGGLATFIIYGILLNTASVFMMYSKFSIKVLIACILSGIPFDFVHAVATIFFLFILSNPMIEKLDRIKIKYGLIEP